MNPRSNAVTAFGAVRAPAAVVPAERPHPTTWAYFASKKPGLASLEHITTVMTTQERSSGWAWMAGHPIEALVSLVLFILMAVPLIGNGSLVIRETKPVLKLPVPKLIRNP
jgi:hypothetical protein